MQRKFCLIATIVIIASIIFTGCDSNTNSGKQINEHTLNVNLMEGSGTIRQDGQRFRDGEIVYLTTVEEDWQISEIEGDGITQENGEWKILMDQDRHIEVYLEKKKYIIERETNLPNQSIVVVTVAEAPSDFDGRARDIDPLNPPHGTVIKAEARVTTGTFSRWEKDAVEYGSANPIYIVVEEDLFLRAVFSVGSTSNIGY